MQLNLPTVLALKKISEARKAEQQTADVSGNDNQPDHDAESRSRKRRLQDWLSPKPDTIQSFPGEKEIFRKSLILVTDTRLAYIDPFDRVLKTYMFEHMISVHKHFYRPTVSNRRLCKALLALCVLVFFIILTIDLLDNSSSGFFLVYIPLFASMLIGIKVWNDMKPWYAIHWRMRDQTYGEIVQVPLLGERIKGDNTRETFMNDLVNSMNQALSAKAWWPTQGHYANSDALTPSPHEERSPDENQRPDSLTKKATTRLKLVTDTYQ